MAVDKDTFRKVLGSFAAGVTVITVKCGELRHGMTATAFSSLSLDPPLVLVCVAKTTMLHGLLAEAGSFAVNILAEGQADVSNQYASKEEADHQRFDRVTCRVEQTGAPIFNEALAWADCRLVAAHDGGDHTIYVGEMLAGGADAEREPLLFYRGKYGRYQAAG